MSDVVFSRESKKVFHEFYCPYAKRIANNHRVRVPEEIALKEGVQECKFCRSVRGMVYKYRELSDYEISYDSIDKCVCVKTPVGFWKIFWRETTQCWHLFHMNSKGRDCFNPELSSKVLMRGAFHRQDGYLPTGSLNKAMKYIRSHDECYKQAEEHGIKSMPQHTPKQRLHYRQQKNRKRKESIKNVFKIFDQLEKEKKR